MKLKLKIWRQDDKNSQGSFKNYSLENVSKDASFRNVRFIK